MHICIYAGLLVIVIVIVIAIVIATVIVVIVIVIVIVPSCRAVILFFLSQCTLLEVSF